MRPARPLLLLLLLLPPWAAMATVVDPPYLWDVNGAGDPRIRGFASQVGVQQGEEIGFSIRVPAAALPGAATQDNDATSIPQEEKAPLGTGSFEVRVYRLGYYAEFGGRGALRVATLGPFSAAEVANQPTCLELNRNAPVDERYLAKKGATHGRNSRGKQPPSEPPLSTHETHCGNWKTSVTWQVPQDARSGLYAARITAIPDSSTGPEGVKTVNWRADGAPDGADFRFADRNDAFAFPEKRTHSYGARGLNDLREPLVDPVASHIYFVVRDGLTNGSGGGGVRVKHDILLQTADATWNAYNQFGGRSTYGSYSNSTAPRCLVASTARPLLTRRDRPVNSP
jgi:N,N-dimethylformamidase beta subunit-like, C-terminal